MFNKNIKREIEINLNVLYKLIKKEVECDYIDELERLRKENESLKKEFRKGALFV